MKRDPRSGKRRNRPAFCPRLECLEDRTQPGSLLTAGLDLSGLGAEFDPNALPATNSQTESLPIIQRPDNTNGTTAELSVAVVVGAPPSGTASSGTVSTSSLTLSPGTPMDLSGASQAAGHVAAVSGSPATVPPSAVAPVQAAGVVPPNVANAGGMAVGQAVGSVGGVNPAVATAPLQPLTNVHTHTYQISNLGDGSGGGRTQNWLTYLGGPGNDSVQAVVYSGGNLYMTGYMGDAADPTAVDLFIARMDTGGATATVVTQNMGSMTRAIGYGIDVDGSGNVYVGGSVDAGMAGTNLVVEKFDSSLAPVWSVTSPDPSAVKSVKLDASGTNLFYTGEDGTGTYGHDLLVGKLTGLGNATPTTVYSSIFAIDTDTGPGPSDGNAVGVDPISGQADIVGLVIANSGADARSMIGQVSSDGSSYNAFIIWHSVGLTNQSNGIYVDSAGNIYQAGSYKPAPGNPGDQTDNLLIAARTRTGDAIFGWYYYATAADFNSYGSAIVVQNGTPYYAGTDTAGTTYPGQKEFYIFKFANDGSSIINAEGLANNADGDDYGYGLTLDNFQRAIVVGKTASHMLPTTAGAYQGTFQGGTTDGYAGSYTV